MPIGEWSCQRVCIRDCTSLSALLREWHELTCVAAAVAAAGAWRGVALAGRSQRGALTIPGADTVTYMNEDLDIFSWALPESDMRTLDAQTEPGRQYWDPHQIP